MISFSNINKQYGKQLLFVDASFQLNPGEKVGLVGPNGAGKTTLFLPIRTRFWLLGIGRYACSSTCREMCFTIDPCRSHLPATALSRLSRRCRQMPPSTMPLNGSYFWRKSQLDWPSLMGPRAFRTIRPNIALGCNAHSMVATIAARS